LLELAITFMMPPLNIYSSRNHAARSKSCDWLVALQFE
jgi:hypothetical protein